MSEQEKQTRISEDLYYTQLNESTYQITHYFPRWGGNALLVLVGDQNAVLIDTPFEDSGTKALHNWIAETFGELKVTVINTGYHQDNLGGNHYLRSVGAEIYGSDLTKKLLIETEHELKELIVNSVTNQPSTRYADSYKSLVLTPPDIIFPIKKGLTLTIGDESFEVFYPGESHAPDNVVVYLKNRRILFGGCMLKGKIYKKPGFLKHANMAEWPKAISRVKEKYPAPTIVVPGHGEAGGKELYAHMSRVLKNWHTQNSKQQ